MIGMFIKGVFPTNIVGQAFLVASIGAVLTVVGAIPALIGVKFSEVFIDIGMGFSAGVMLTASFTSLLIPAMEVGGALPTVLGFVLGVTLMVVMDKFLPHEHLIKGYEGPPAWRRRLRVAWLMAFAIIIHNIPEGAAVGATVAEDLRDGIILAIAIGIQNVPEGFAVALPLITMQKRPGLGLGLATFSGVVEPLAAALAATIVMFSRQSLPYALSLAAGAMVYIVSHEIIPETHRYGHELHSTIGLVIGLLLMFILDQGLTIDP